MPKDAATNHAADTPWQSTMTYAEFADLGRDSITAAIDSNAALSAGLEAIGQEVALYARDTLESVGETARGMLNARTFEDFVRLQTEFAKRNFAGLVERTAKFSELGCSLFGATVGAWTGRAKTSL